MSQDNPYRAPQTSLQNTGFSRGDIFRVVCLGIFIGGSLGALTNAVNGLIGPGHFVSIFGWQEFIWLRIVFQGILEGSLYGLGNALIFVGIANILGKGIPSVSIVSRDFLKIAAVVFCCWLIGGYLGWQHGMILSLQQLPLRFFAFNPNWQSSGNAWVLGSIRLAIHCSPFVTLIFAIFFANRKLATSNID